ncbi:hypothetical protein [Haloechinothrix sp. LS1_15]|uniref:hypothetical protein n=1 Tax=Haloechinothrix sp. LS1_15 TaxID=2652248 RepID=UPI0029462303|nr:hypothetical protein [Haloechinothrix sp. LS1_15]MDV6013596.1 hypothetical protein [Haloechinothrix sp. LS1_15]
MSDPGSLARWLAGVGDVGDALVRAVARVPQTLRTVLARRPYRGVVLIAGSVVLLLYLVAIGDLAASLSGRWAGSPTVQFVDRGVFDARAPYLFEPLLALYPGAHLAVFVSPVNIALGAVLALLVGCSLAVAAYTARHAVACRRPGYSGVLAAAPAFLLGFACCVPTFLLVLGTGVAASLMPVLVPLQPVFYPLALVLVGGTLVWSTRRLRALTGAG